MQHFVEKDYHQGCAQSNLNVRRRLKYAITYCTITELPQMLAVEFPLAIFVGNSTRQVAESALEWAIFFFLML